MRMNKQLLVGTIFFASLFVSVKTNAEEMPTKMDTPVKIQLERSPLHLMEVTAPTFGSYEITNKSQTIQATGDLVITIQDARSEESSPWQLDYEISVFSEKATNKETNSTLKYKVGTGTLKINDKPVDATAYQAQTVELGQEKRGTLIKTTSSSLDNYEYRVPKEKISIDLPSNSSVGEYRAIQTVHLVSLPESE